MSKLERLLSSLPPHLKCQFEEAFQTISVLPIGTMVKLGFDEDKFTGRVFCIQIVNNGDVLYEVEWWNNRSRSTGLFTRSQLETTDLPRHQIGFEVPNG